MRGKELAQLVTCSSLAAFAFLCHAGIATAPQRCGNDYKWSFHKPGSGAMPYFWCREPIGEPVRRRGKKGRVRNRSFTCNEKAMWREWFPWSQKVTKMKPEQLVDAMYHWSMQHSVEETSHEMGLHRATVGDFFAQCRETVSEFTANATRGEKLGGPGRIVYRRDAHHTEVTQPRRFPRTHHAGSSDNCDGRCRA